MDKLYVYCKLMFEYVDGTLYRRFTTGGRAVKGSRVGSYHAGYRRVRVLDKAYLEHRLIYLMHHLCMPKLIDHDDTDRGNNRIGNLLDSNKSKNRYNSGLNVNNTSGYKGISLTKSGKYEAYAYVNGSRTFLGTYSSALAAHNIYLKYSGTNELNENGNNDMSNKTDESLNFSVTCVKPNGEIVTHKYHKLLDVLIERNNSATKVMALFDCCDQIKAGELVDGEACNMRGYTFKRV